MALGPRNHLGLARVSLAFSGSCRDDYPNNYGHDYGGESQRSTSDAAGRCAMRAIGMRLAMMLAIATAPVVNPGVAEAAGITYTVEPFDLDGIGGMSMSVTQKQLGGALCPCVKVPYPADGLHNDAGSAAIANAPRHSVTQCSDSASDRR
jgi:hypothetical protein